MPCWTQEFAMTERSRDFRARFRRHVGAVCGAWLFAAIVALICLGPALWPIEPGFVDPMNRDQGSSWAHPMGTDQLGRDIFARVLAGGRISLAVGLAAMAVALSLGIVIGVLAGFVRWLDAPLMRLTDLFLALPILPLLMVMVMLFRAPLSQSLGPELGTFLLVVGAIGVTGWMPTARILRGEVLALKERDFILAARSAGTRGRHIITRHILPNVASPILVSAALGIATAILIESALSFLSLGFPPDFPSWGRLLRDGTVYLESFPARALWPGLAITLTILAVNLIGDGLRDALANRTRRIW